MASEGVDLAIFGAMTAVFLVITLVLGWYGYKNTRNNEEFLLGRNKTGPVIIALSYGATFLSASAVIGFGGQAAVHGMSVMWLCLLKMLCMGKSMNHCTLFRVSHAFALEKPVNRHAVFPERNLAKTSGHWSSSRRKRGDISLHCQ